MDDTRFFTSRRAAIHDVADLITEEIFTSEEWANSQTELASTQAHILALVAEYKSLKLQVMKLQDQHASLDKRIFTVADQANDNRKRLDSLGAAQTHIL